MLAVNSIGYLANVISDVIDKARRSRKYNEYQLHHIVAQKDFRAEWTRELLEKYGLDVWHPNNLVLIKNTLHRHLHTNAYFAAVDMVLRSYENSKKTWIDKKNAIISGLKMIGILLKLANVLV